jgi:hypothetical protein
VTESHEQVAEPAETVSDTRELLLGYLDYYRAAVLRKLDGMSEQELRGSRLASGWSPLALLRHLAFVERRWFRWGFAAEAVDPVFGDRDPDTHVFTVGAHETVEDVRAFYLDECAKSREIVAHADLSDYAASGAGFNPPDDHPALIWILFHMLSEYARHVGQLDVVRELADGVTGE